MHIRLATTRDLHRLAQITVTSLVDDPAFDYMWPKRHEFPEDNFFFWQLQLKKWLYDPKQTFLVVVLDAEDPSLTEKTVVIPDTIISYVIWERLGHSSVARHRWAEKNTWQNLIDSASTLCFLASVADTEQKARPEWKHGQYHANMNDEMPTRSGLLLYPRPPKMIGASAFQVSARCGIWSSWLLIDSFESEVLPHGWSNGALPKPITREYVAELRPVEWEPECTELVGFKC